MKGANLAVMLLCWLQPITAQQTRSPVTAPYLSSGAYSQQFSDAFCISSNIASLAANDHFSAGVLGERRFMQKETGNYTAVITAPTSTGNFGLRVRYFGYSAYNESELSIGYGRKLSKGVDIGAAINYYLIRISGYGSASAINFELGSVFHITDRLHSGIQVYNPLQSKLGKNTNEKLASVYKAGFGYELSGTVLTTLEVIQESNAATAIHIGIQYKPITQVFARAGFITGNNILYVGAGYRYKQFRMDITSGFHQHLGFSPGILLLYEPQKKKQE